MNAMVVDAGPDDIVVRVAEVHDAPDIFRMICELAEFEELRHEVKATEADIRRFMFGSQRFAEALIADCHGEAVGFIIFYCTFATFPGRPGLWLEDFYVKETHRAKGTGAALLLRIVDIAEQRGCGTIDGSALEWNRGAIELYESLGAQRVAGWYRYKYDLDGDSMRELRRRLMGRRA